MIIVTVVMMVMGDDDDSGSDVYSTQFWLAVSAEG
jgi:hypothetical protein